MITRLEELVGLAKRNPPTRVAVAAAAHKLVLQSVRRAVQQRLIIPMLVGREPDIREHAAAGRAIIHAAAGPPPVLHGTNGTLSLQLNCTHIRGVCQRRKQISSLAHLLQIDGHHDVSEVAACL